MFRTITLAAAVTLFLELTSPAAEPATPATCPLFILRQAESGLTIEMERLADGEVRVLQSNADTGIIDIILPPGPGGSAGLERLGDGRLLIARYAGGSLTVTTKLADGKDYARPPRELDDLREFDVRASVSGDGGVRAAFVILGYESVAQDEVGPVIDLFGGKVPLSPGDYLVSTQTTRRSTTDDSVSGEAALEWLASPSADIGGYLIARAHCVGSAKAEPVPADFVVDLAAGQTVVSKALLPPGTAIESAAMLEHSAAGTRELKYTIGGATGDVQGILGFATVPMLNVGSLSFRDARVLVMNSLFQIGERRIDGILGVDLLRRAQRVTFEWPRGDRPARLMLGGNEPETRAADIAALFSSVGSHVFVRGEVAGRPISLVLDTGSPTCFLDPDAAEACGVTADASVGRAVRGLDGGETTVRAATVNTLSIGGTPLRDVPVEIGRLPVLDKVRAGQHVGLLGNSFFARFDRVVIDFDEHVIRFIPPAD